MSAYENLLVDRTGTGDRIARVTLNRPRRANALSDGLIVDLNDCLHELEADHEVRVVVLKGAGRGFSGGCDLAEDPSDRPRARRFKEVDEQGRNLMANMRASID